MTKVRRCVSAETSKKTKSQVLTAKITRSCRSCSAVVRQKACESECEKLNKMIPKSVQVLGTSVAIIMGGVATLNLASTITLGALRAATEAKRKKVAAPCGACRGKGFYICKLCKGNATIEWSPLYDPVFINPCLCPTCDGNRVQRCLNCLGKGYN